MSMPVNLQMPDLARIPASRLPAQLQPGALARLPDDGISLLDVRRPDRAVCLSLATDMPGTLVLWENGALSSTLGVSSHLYALSYRPAGVNKRNGTIGESIVPCPEVHDEFVLKMCALVVTWMIAGAPAQAA